MRRGSPRPRRSISFATEHHLVERRRDQAREADDVAVLLDGDIEDAIGRHHDAEVDHLVAVAAEHDADDVLADVVDVALDSAEDDPRRRRPLGFIRLHVRLEIRDRTLHRAGALHDLRKEHLSRAEEIADDLHPVHERPFDDVERTRRIAPRLLGVLLDEVDDPVDERVREPVGDGSLAPREVELALRRAARHRGRVLDEPLRRVRAPVEEDVLHPLEQIGLDVLVDRELAGIDDSHVETRADRVVQERRVHRLAYRIVATEREREIRDSSGDERARTALLQERDRVDEGLGEGSVLLDPGRDGQDVRVEDDVVRRESRLGRQQVERAAEDLHLPLDALGLPALVERHDDDRRSERAHRPCLREERLLALLQGDRVDDALPLEAPEAGLECREARAVDHDRKARGFRLGRKKVEEGRHRLLRVEQVGVHVDVQEVRAAPNLLERDVDRTLVVVGLDQPSELRRAGHVRTLAHDDEARVRPDDERIEPGEPRTRRALGDAPRRQSLDRARDRVGVLGGRPAATAHEVDEPVLGEGPQVPARVGRLLVVEPECVRETCVRVTRDVRGCDAREPLQERSHLGRAE